MTKKSRIVVFDDFNFQLKIEEIEIPCLKEEEILVRICYTTLCKSDLLTFTGKRKEKSPTILGHEIVGIISEFGPNCRKEDVRGEQLNVGDRITWSIYASNPESSYSKKGIPQKSEDLIKYGHEQNSPINTLHGGLADYIILRRHTHVVKILKPIPDSIASLINCSVATVAGGIRLAGDLEGKSVLISGAGMLGTVACAMISRLKAKKVIAIDISKSRVEQCKKFGADIAIHLPTDYEDLVAEIRKIDRDELKIDVIYEFSGKSSMMITTLDLLDIGGIAIWIGGTYPQKHLSIDTEMIIRRLLTIKGLHNYNETDLLNAVTFMENSYSYFNFESLIAKPFPITEVYQAFEYAIHKNPYRVGIDFSLNSSSGKN